MTLHEFLLTSKIAVREFARRCDTSASTIIRLRDFQTIPSRRVLDAIHRETDGQVRVEELIRIETKPSAEAPAPLGRDERGQDQPRPADDVTVYRDGEGHE